MGLEERAWKLINSRHMLPGMGVASFFESIIVPIPLEAVLIPAMQLKRSRIWALATAALVGCLAGAVLGYALGYFLFDAVGDRVVEWFSSPEEFDEIRRRMHEDGFWFVLLLGVVPVPFQVAMVAAGLANYSVPLFLLATLIARSVRYYGLAWLVLRFGDRAEGLFTRHKTAAAVVLGAVVIGLWWSLRHLR